MSFKACQDIPQRMTYQTWLYFPAMCVVQIWKLKCALIHQRNVDLTCSTPVGRVLLTMLTNTGSKTDPTDKPPTF